MHIGYCIGKEWWYKGIAAEALKAVIEFLFEKTGAQSIAAAYDVNNPNSGAVMRKAGMRCIGTFEKAVQNNQGICDVTMYSMSKSEWENGEV